MTPSFFTQWFSEPLVHALCWTLIHSLWIGLLAAGLAGLAMMVTTKAPARLRYLLFCGVLWMFTLTMGLVFCLELTGQRAERAVVATEGPLTDWQASPAITITIASNDIALIHQIVDFINDQLNWIFTIWWTLPGSSHPYTES